jgi:hypothetical protein
MKKLISIIMFIISYIPAFLFTFVFDGVKGIYPFIYNSHQTIKFLLDK